MELLVLTIGNEIKTLQKNKIRLNAIGNIAALPDRCKKELLSAIEKTKNNDRMTLTLALSYGSREEIVEMVKKIASEVKAGNIETNEINESLISNHLYTAGIPDPELVIRTSGEHRISNFLLWQIAYAEFYFLEKFWPDFSREDLYQSIYDFQNRERRFGKISEQITS
jgi:undecaprenyl diphosphate synthase